MISNIKRTALVFLCGISIVYAQTKALKMVVKLPADKSSGIHEWVVNQ